MHHDAPNDGQATPPLLPNIKARVAAESGADVITILRAALARALNEVIVCENAYHATTDLGEKATQLAAATQYARTSVLSTPWIEVVDEVESNLYECHEEALAESESMPDAVVPGANA